MTGMLISMILLPIFAGVVMLAVWYRPQPPRIIETVVEQLPAVEYFSKATITGYQDMAYALYTHEAVPYRNDTNLKATSIDGVLGLADQATFEYLALQRVALNNFDPDKGRIEAHGYMSSPDDDDWNEYYAGGIQFLQDIRARAEKNDEKSRLIESRRMGAKELDAHFTQPDLADFDKMMKEMEK